ncbi:MAG: lysophospholipid acyltransferase family protein [Holophaga sp.]|nr:lysophospholipid acyltransferase family protein [Holophaga sp.]
MARTTQPTLVHRLQYGLAMAVIWLVSGLSWRIAWTLGRAVGHLYYLIDARHRRVVRENLRSSDLGLTETEITALSRDCFAHFGALLFTTLRILQTTPEEIRRITRIEGREHIEAAFREGKGIIGLTGHMGNWELLALALSLGGWKMAEIGRALDNPLLEARLRAFRTAYGNSVIAKDGAVRGSIKALKEGQMIGFLLDQDALTGGVFVKFMGRWASTFSTAAVLALRFDLPVLPVSSRVGPDGVVTLTAYPPFHVANTGDPARDAWVGTQRMTRWIEQRVRENPTQWFWMHRRFKTQPGPGQPEPPPEAWVQADQAESG